MLFDYLVFACLISSRMTCGLGRYLLVMTPATPGICTCRPIFFFFFTKSSVYEFDDAKGGTSRSTFMVQSAFVESIPGPRSQGVS